MLVGSGSVCMICWRFVMVRLYQLLVVEQIYGMSQFGKCLDVQKRCGGGPVEGVYRESVYWLVVWTILF